MPRDNLLKRRRGGEQIAKEIAARDDNRGKHRRADAADSVQQGRGRGPAAGAPERLDEKQTAACRQERFVCRARRRDGRGDVALDGADIAD